MDSIPIISLRTTWALISIVIVVLGLALKSILNYHSKRSKAYKLSTTEEKLDPYTSINAIPDFDWRTTEPLALRPFKSQYHLTMGLSNITMNELVEIDSTYEDRIKLRRQIMRDHPSTLDFRPGSEAAVHEFYKWMTAIYLPQRFPTMYSLRDDEQARHLHCLATDEAIPPHPTSAREALQTLGAHIDTDFLFLMPSSSGDGKYHLEAFVTTFPSGFSTLAKLGQPLAAIHKPVPGYSAKLEKSMDRFFASIPVGRIVRRANWSVTTNDLLYAESGNHLYAHGEGEGLPPVTNGKTLDVASPGLEAEIARQKAEVRVPECRLRCERQTLHRLPDSKALVFAFKTYQYKLADVKAEGSGEELATAIEGLGIGNVPEMAFYKRAVVWGDKVKEYLRN